MTELVQPNHIRRGLMARSHFLSRVRESGLRQKFFRVLAEGQFEPEQVSAVILSAGECLKRSAKSEAIIEDAWQKHLAAGNKPWPNDLVPTRFHLADLEVYGSSRLEIALDPCISYRDFIGSRVPALLAGPHSFVPDPLAVTTVLIASDSKGQDHALLTVRSLEHDYKPGGYHVLGGFMDLRKDKGPTDTAFRETEEECGIAPNEVTELRCLGVVRNLIEGHADVIYSARTSIPAEEVLARKNDGENRVILIPVTPEKLREWIIVPTHANVVITSAALIMVGKQVFSARNRIAAESWYEEMMHFLAYRSKDYDDPAEVMNLEKRDIARFRTKISRL